MCFTQVLQVLSSVAVTASKETEKLPVINNCRYESAIIMSSHSKALGNVILNFKKVTCLVHCLSLWGNKYSTKQKE